MVFVRGELGPELEIVVLEMTQEEQMERIKGRHEGNQDAVQMMKVGTLAKSGTNILNL